MPQLFVEIFGEEIPAKMQTTAANQLNEKVQAVFKEAHIDHGTIQTFVTPRRLVFVVDDLPETQPDVTLEKKGPRINAPAQALEGFLKANQITLDQCEKRETPKGEFYFLTVTQKGKTLTSFIPLMIDDLLKNFHWPKSMRWNTARTPWVRPIHSGICLFNDHPLAFTVTFGKGLDVVFSNTTRGHRFLSQGQLTIKSFKDYQKQLATHHVILDQKQRQQDIWQQATALAKTKNLEIVKDEGLLDENTGLVEKPFLYLGHIDKRFMALPKEVLITVMKVHQKYFSLQTKKGDLAPYCIITSNTTTHNQGREIISGNERVLRARLSDAEFFYNNDQATSLEDHAQKLSSLIFHKDLGSVLDKTERLQALSTIIATHLGEDKALAERAALLSKADLVTEMVGEFPELQGTMGRYYAKAENPAVGLAIQEHYQPKSIHGTCPTATLSKIVGLADRLDTLVGFFSINIKPTGSKDPYALRRAALGILRILESGLSLKLEILIEASFKTYTSLPKEALTLDTLKENLFAFFLDRLKVYWRDQGLQHDVISAVFQRVKNVPLWEVQKCAHALQAFLKGNDGENLLSAYRRASNIVLKEEKKDKKRYNGQVDDSLLSLKEENNLLAELKKNHKEIAIHLNTFEFEKAMTCLAKLRPFVDQFFDKVTVNDNTPNIRTNRLHLLSTLKTTVEQVADFSRIELPRSSS